VIQRVIPKKWEPVFGKDHAQNKNLERDDDSKRNHSALVAETGTRIELYLALMLLCGRRSTKFVALRETIRRKCHQGGGDAGSGGRHRELRISLGELPVVFRSDHDRPPSTLASCSSAGNQREQQQPTGRTPVRLPSRMISLPQSDRRVLGADLNRSESSWAGGTSIPLPEPSVRGHPYEPARHFFCDVS
jgi:hypothetical protein